MDFEFTEEQREFRKHIARYVDERVVPVAESLDDTEQFPRDIVRELGELGYLGIKYPEEYGGSGLKHPHVFHCIFCEELARGSLGVASALGMHTSTATHTVFAFGTEELKHKYLVPALSGEKIAAFGLTEPGAGSDAAAIRTQAVRTDKGYVLNGTKMFISNGTVADFVTIAAKTLPDKGVHGISLFLVDTKTAGFSVGRRLEKFSNKSSDTAELVLEDVEVPADHLLGEENKGFVSVYASLTVDRIMTAALALGLARSAYRAAYAYSREREQFGRPICKFQAVQFRLVDMLAQLKSAELQTYYAAWVADNRQNPTEAAAMAKLVASEAANRICTMATSIFGGYGLMKEFPVQRYLRDSFFPLVAGGTNDIMKLIIARQIGL
ncbi:MAG TPA: acyl-CoA dehydrogenase family protein [Desulfomonilaceae bacterium]|nr:acyl-CoA dehydrogenase family protein [Desulfomonilaceae bacterium]